MEPWSHDFAGRVDEHLFASEALGDNPLGDPAERPLWVYVPPGYDEDDRRYPSVYVLQGYTGHIAMWRNRTPFRRPFPEEADAGIARGEIPPCILVYVDAWTAYGGSQYVDSPGTGRYHTYLCDEIVPWVDEHYRTLAAREHRGVAGKSSGGFGALVTPLLRPDLFGGLASHAGDSLYEHCYIHEFATCARALRDDYGGSYERFWEDFRSRPPMSKETDSALVMIYGVAAAFSADDDGIVRLPFDLETGALVPEVWSRWLAWDPLRMIPDHSDTVRALRAIYLDAGKRDEWYLDLGAQALKAAFEAAGAESVHLELFEGTHMGVDYRYPVGLRFLAERLAA